MVIEPRIDPKFLAAVERMGREQNASSEAPKVPTSGEAILHIYAEVKGWLIGLAKLMTWLLIANWLWMLIF